MINFDNYVNENKTKRNKEIDKIYLYAKYPCEAKYQYLINIQEKVGLKRFNDPKAIKVLISTM